MAEFKNFEELQAATRRLQSEVSVVYHGHSSPEYMDIAAMLAKWTDMDDEDIGRYIGAMQILFAYGNIRPKTEQPEQLYDTNGPSLMELLDDTWISVDGYCPNCKNHIRYDTEWKNDEFGDHREREGTCTYCHRRVTHVEDIR